MKTLLYNVLFHEANYVQNPAAVYLFKVNSRNTKTMCENWSKLNKFDFQETTCSGVFIVNLD